MVRGTGCWVHWGAVRVGFCRRGHAPSRVREGGPCQRPPYPSQGALHAVGRASEHSSTRASYKPRVPSHERLHREEAARASHSPAWRTSDHAARFPAAAPSCIPTHAPSYAAHHQHRPLRPCCRLEPRGRAPGLQPELKNGRPDHLTQVLSQTGPSPYHGSRPLDDAWWVSCAGVKGRHEPSRPTRGAAGAARWLLQPPTLPAGMGGVRQLGRGTSGRWSCARCTWLEKLMSFS